MDRVCTGLAVFLVAAIAVSVARPAAAQTYVDLELILAVDVSGSVDPDEANLQREGYIAAFQDPDVIRCDRERHARPNRRRLLRMGRLRAHPRDRRLDADRGYGERLCLRQVADHRAATDCPPHRDHLGDQLCRSLFREQYVRGDAPRHRYLRRRGEQLGWAGDAGARPGGRGGRHDQRAADHQRPQRARWLAAGPESRPLLPGMRDRRSRGLHRGGKLVRGIRHRDSSKADHRNRGGRTRTRAKGARGGVAIQR